MIDLTLTGVTAALAISLGMATVATDSHDEVTRIPKEKARSMLENSELTAIDVRMPHDWEASDMKIFGAVREDPYDAGSWANKYPKDKALLSY
jgi:hypothetical protein